MNFTFYFRGLQNYLVAVAFLGTGIITGCAHKTIVAGTSEVGLSGREKISLNDGWRFFRYDDDSLRYDVWPKVNNRNDNKVADSRPEETAQGISAAGVLKPWILPTANPFIQDSSLHHARPTGNPGANFPFVQARFDDNNWQQVQLPHDWAIDQPFYVGDNVPVGGGMGRLPIQGVGWYRKKINLTENDLQKSIYLDIDGAMAYSMVWCNGKLVGGWPYGYNSYRLDLTPYIDAGENQLAIRLDNPPNSSRWYPGGGIYRNVWITKTNKLHVSQWGTFIRCENVSSSSATVHLDVQVQNNTASNADLQIQTEIFLANKNGTFEKRVATFPRTFTSVKAGASVSSESNVILNNPALWGPPPAQQPNLYTAVTKIYKGNELVDEYVTHFGVRSLEFDPVKGMMVNGKPLKIQGVNQHHDLGALGAAFNTRAAERQLEMLQEMGCNAIRLAHNPPAPELLDLTDKMGFLVVDEIFDCWERGKTPLDFHLIFNDWHEADVRAFIRRDRNHPSVIEWSFGNEVGEQYTAEAGAKMAKQLYNIVKEEDSTRPATASMNYAKPDMPFASVMDVISLNYQGEGIRDAPAYAHLRGIKTSPLYDAFQKKFPGEMIQSSETASALSTRGTYIFPVFGGISAPVSDSTGGDPVTKAVSAYELYTAQFGASPDKVFAAQDQHPFVAGEFVWSGWDYLGEPTPYYSARSSYSGIIDLAGFKKDRFYLYQSRWKPGLPMAHILPHWSWPGREGLITPVHVFTSGDEAELFLNNVSLGRKKKGPYEYRLRWDDVKYQPGQLRVVAYKNGKRWAEDKVETAGAASQLLLVADRKTIDANGEDLIFITVKITDSKGNFNAGASNAIQFSLEGPGEIIATDNGDPADLTSFASKERKAYNGLALAIVRSKIGQGGPIILHARSAGLAEATISIQAK